jgi:GTP-binding protein
VRVIVRVRMRVIVRVVVGVIVGVRVRMAVVLVHVGVPGAFPRDVGHHLEPALFHPARREHLVGRALHDVGGPAHDDDLEAVIVVEVDVHGGTHRVPEAVLNLGELLREVAHVMVVDERERRDARLALAHLLLRHLGAHEIPQDLGAGRPSGLDEGVELGEERVFHGDPEPDEHVFHRVGRILAGKAGHLRSKKRPRGAHPWPRVRANPPKVRRFVKFVDVCEVKVHAGRGGNGAIAFRREKYVPFGGPAGGDGGRGGDVVFRTDSGLSTLLDLTYAHSLRAKDGENGHGSDCYGRGAEDLVCRVPVGTQVFDADTGELLFDLTEGEVDTVVAKGGRGGRGNIHFATAQDRAPRRAEPGEPGEERAFRLELKVLADVGLLGFPNVGKSTFVRAVSRARPKVADYPFTTLVPHLGVVRIDDEASFVIADIPGLIPGAAEGAGLGHRFLKHVERTRALLHLVTLDPGEGRDPVADYDALKKELRTFDPELAKRPTIVALAKADLPEVKEAYPELRARFAKKKIKLHLVSAATHEGMKELVQRLYELVLEGRREAALAAKKA